MDIQTKEKLDFILEKYGVKIRWKNYEYMIERDYITKYIDEISKIGLNVYRINWWCKCLDNNKSLWCPHWAWGPWFEGWHYGEIYRAYNVEIEDNETAKDIILNREVRNRDWDMLTFEKNPCLIPSIFVQ